jgi:hypothetical protein
VCGKSPARRLGLQALRIPIFNSNIFKITKNAHAFRCHEMKKLLLLFAFFLVTIPLNAEIYQWVDENGVTRFSNTNPPQDHNKLKSQKEIKSTPNLYFPRQTAPGTIVTYSEYKSIRDGMTYQEVSSIIGQPGEETARNRMEGTPGVMEPIETVIYQWSNPDGSNMSATFQNNKLVQKAQAGLR